MLSPILTGALAGCIATAPMTIAMEALFRLLPRPQQYPLPPSEITASVTDSAGIDQHLDQHEHVALSLVNHFAYGATCGAIYGTVARSVPVAPVVRGTAFGLLVWTISYLGLLPALGILRPATEHPPARNLLMIAAHVVWGAVLGVLADRWQPR